jgi:predicted NBD/HSP70 family sugar kinase
VAAAARRHDKLALNIFRRCGTLLGSAVANLVSLFDPQIVILGGGVGEAADLYLESVQRAILERAQPLAAGRVKLTVSRLGPTTNLLGCARLAWELAGIRPLRSHEKGTKTSKTSASGNTAS